MVHFSNHNPMYAGRHTLLVIIIACFCVGDAMAQTWTWNWVRKNGTSGFNDSFCTNPLNDDILYASPGNNTIIISRDRGNTWQTFSTLPGGSQVKAIEVSARDTSVMLVAQEAGPPDRIMKTTNRGVTWFQTLAGNFYYWGHPIAYQPSANDETVYTEAGNTLYRSRDFGSTWDTVRVNPFSSSNNGWEDALIFPDSIKVLLVADNANGIWKSRDEGVTWRRVYVASGEVPALAYTPTNPGVVYGAKWGGGGGFVKTTDYGETWQAISFFNGMNMWGVAVSTKDPNYVVTGTWGHSYSSNGGLYVSRNAGVTWERTYLGLGSTSNHALHVLDTLSVFALQGDGIWKLRFPGTIEGSVYDDLNGNGVRDSSESVLVGRRIRMTGTRIDSTLTDISGRYTFKLLGPGSYTVMTAPVSTWVTTEPVTGSYTVTVADGERYENRVFGISRRLLTLLQPNGGETCSVGDSLYISWQTRFSGGPVALELSRDGGQTFEILLPSTPDDGNEPWVVTGPSTTAALLRVSNVSMPGVADTSDGEFIILDRAVTSISAGWNMVSVSVTVPDLRRTILFPEAISGAFLYTLNGYVQVDTLNYSKGYWLKFPSSSLLQLNGGTRSTDTIDVFAGWNMIGSITTPMPVADIGQIPAGIVISPFYGAPGYSPVDTIRTMNAYWVKVSQAGRLLLQR